MTKLDWDMTRSWLGVRVSVSASKKQSQSAHSTYQHAGYRVLLAIKSMAMLRCQNTKVVSIMLHEEIAIISCLFVFFGDCCDLFDPVVMISVFSFIPSNRGVQHLIACQLGLSLRLPEAAIFPSDELAFDGLVSYEMIYCAAASSTIIG